MRIKGNHRFAIINHLFANVFFQYYFLQASLVAYLFLLQGHAAYAQGQTKPISPEAQKTEAAEQQAPTGELNGNGLSAPGISSDSYGGMVINQTITVAGQDFFQYFIGAWLDKDMADKYQISINERPSARLGSQIWINYRQRRVYQVILPASRASVKPVSLLAAENVYAAVVQSDMQQLLFKDPDLAPDEF